jgi:N-acetylglucosamine-6-phosphate deacetylase
VGNIKIVNVVPEWGSAGINLIRYLTARNIICAAGHTGATGRQYGKAIESGLKLAVHFLNGPTGSSSKSFDGGGAVETVLRSDKMSVEIIVDGYHVDKAYVRDTIRRKGFDRVAAITDSMFAAQMPGLTDFEVAGIKGKVGDNGEYLQVAGRENALFGSKLTMDKAFTNLLNWLTEPVRGIWYAEHEKLPFEEALLKTAMMCSSNPARILGFDNNHNETRKSGKLGKQPMSSLRILSGNVRGIILL